jgi:pimeloyl-ACP methyl ester carboxylesterase
MTSRRRRRLLLRTILVVIPVYALVMTFGGCASRLLLHPSRHSIDAGGAVRRSVAHDGRQIEIWTARSPALREGRQPQAYVLEFCGNATRAEEIAQFVADRWKKHRVEVWVMNYPGFGGSDGPAELKAIVPSSMATYDALAAVACGRPIFIEANSMGTVPALHVAARRAVAGLVLQNPPPLRRLVLERYGWWNLWLVAGPIALQIPADLDSIDGARRASAPAVFLTGDADALVPPKYQQLVIEAYAGPKRVIRMPGTTHWQPVTGQAESQLAREIDRLWDTALR